MTNAQQGLDACVAVLKRLQTEAKQRFGLASGEMPKHEGLMKWPLRLRTLNNSPVYAEYTLHREHGHSPHFALRYGEKPSDVALLAKIVWKGGRYVVECSEPDQGRHLGLKRAVAQLRDIAAASSHTHTPPVFNTVEAAILI